MTNYQELKLRKRFRYIVYKLNDDNTSVVISRMEERPASASASGDGMGKAKEDYARFVSENLPEDDCRYAVYDFEFEKSPGEGVRNKICFVVWYGLFIPISFN